MSTTGQPLERRVQIAEESYRRCQSEAFFQAFYRRLLDTDERTRAKFAHTDFDRQNRLLAHGIGLLFIFARRQNPVLLARIADRHAAHDLDIPPGLYPHFEESLVATAREHDPEWTPEVEGAWRVAIAPGMEFMKGRYRATATPAAG